MTASATAYGDWRDDAPGVRRFITPADLPSPYATRSTANRRIGVPETSIAARTLYISGQIGQRMDGTIPDDIVEHSRLAWQNLEAQLKAAGMTLDNLVKITTILPNGGDVVAAREARSKALGDRKPASTRSSAASPTPAWKIEIEGVAVA